MLEVGNKLKVYCPGEGTFEIIVDKVMSLPYNVSAKDYKGGYYSIINNLFWNGPAGKVYFTLDKDNNVLATDEQINQEISRRS